MAQQVPSGVSAEDPRPETGDTLTEAADTVELSFTPNEPAKTAPGKGWRFWAILVALAASKLMLALETTIVSTALPTIAHTLDMGPSYVWVSNGAALASAAIVPLLGQLSDLFGRQYPTCLSVLLFVVGGIICGSAASGPQLIAGRVVQGLGAGGINVMSAIVVSDLVPVRHRGKYVAVMLTAYLVGAASGPLLGGVLVQNGAWRWVFWLPAPFGVVSFLVLAVCLKARRRHPNSSYRERLRRVDYGGNALLILATGAMLYAVTYAGSDYPWSDARIVAALAAGVLGMGLFLLLQRHLGRSGTAEPVMPLRLLNHRAGATVAAGAFSSSLLSNWANFLLPVYFQGVRMSTPSRAGVQMLPIVAVAVPASIVSVVLVSKLGRYKMLHVAGFMGICIACGLLSMLGETSGDAEWALIEILFSLGLGMVINTLLPAFQGAVSESDQALATSTFTFLQSLATIWSVTIPAAIFNNRCESLADTISDEQIRQQVGGGRAYGLATQAFLGGLSEPAKGEVVGVFGMAVSSAWYAAAGIAGVAVLLACAEVEVVLRVKLKTDFGLKEGDEVKLEDTPPK